MKTYVLDASALLAILQKGPGAGKVTELFKAAVRGHARLLMSAVNYGEVYGRILRDRGAAEARSILQAVRPLPIEILEVTLQRAMDAAEVKNRYSLYYLDSFAAALAMEHGAALVTGDSDFRKLGRNFQLVWLKN